MRIRSLVSVGACLLAALAVLAWSGPAIAGPDTEAPAEPASLGISQLGGPTSVGGQIKQDAASRRALLDSEIERWLKPYTDFKKKLHADHGLAFGLDYMVSAQAATESLSEDFAAGSVFRFYGSWNVVGRGSKNPGSLVFKVEHRVRLGTDIAPQDLGTDLGYAGITAIGFSNKGWILTNFYWNQELANGRVGLVVGIVDTTDYVDTYALVSPWTDFGNLAFSTDPTIPAPNQGPGAAVSFRFTKQIYLVGGTADRNGDPHDPIGSIESFFDDPELFSTIELGWMGSYETRFQDNVHITAWYADSQEAAQVASGWGIAFSWNRLFGDTWEPFVRGGFAQDGGALLDASISVGLGYHIDSRDDLLAIGLNWGRPSEELYGSGLDDQYTLEIYYRLHLLPHLTITPDIQLLLHPALNPDEDLIAVFGVRVRFDF